MLIIFGGLPASGKSTISRQLAEKLGALYLRIDSIETAIVHSSLSVNQAEDAGYFVAYSVAKDNLILGHTVIADSVNSVEISRKAWRQVATKQGKKFLEIEVICSDQKEHKRRLEVRNADIYDKTPIVTWEKVLQREYEVWETVSLRLDTSQLTTKDCVQKTMGHLKM